MSETPFYAALPAGAAAGTAVDIALFPLDTVKTRLQAAQGFWKAGGFRGIYNGISPVIAGSAPGAATFFTTYEMMKSKLKENCDDNQNKDIPIHMFAAGCGEITACLVRVPTELIKQKMQTVNITSQITAVETIRKVINREGFLGLYRGFGSTVFREIPFSVLQFPMYEYFKVKASKKLERGLLSWEAAFCGSISGGIAAALTTPLDVIKTRIMLGKDINGVEYRGWVDAFNRIRREGGIKKLYAGIAPRTMWISIGGFIFFGVYEQVRVLFI